MAAHPPAPATNSPQTSTSNIDLETNGDGSHTTADAYYNGDAGWDPIGSNDNPYNASFNGNGFVVDNLTITRTSTGIGISCLGFRRSSDHHPHQHGHRHILSRIPAVI